MIQITAVINFHREGALAQASIESAVRAVDCATRAGIRCELLAILDRSDAATRKVIEVNLKRREVRLEETNFGELSSARNHAVSIAQGSFVGFLDADDLWCREWLAAAFREAQQEPAAIYHPAVNVMFGAKEFLFAHPDQRDPQLSLDSLRSVNYWTSLSFAARSIYERFPYLPNRLDQGFGFEDWAWHCQTIKEGIEHRIVPQTTHFIRSKPSDSLRDRTVAKGCLRSATDLFLFPDRRHRTPLASL